MQTVLFLYNLFFIILYTIMFTFNLFLYLGKKTKPLLYALVLFFLLLVQTLFIYMDGFLYDVSLAYLPNLAFPFAFLEITITICSVLLIEKAYNFTFSRRLKSATLAFLLLMFYLPFLPFNNLIVYSYFSLPHLAFCFFLIITLYKVKNPPHFLRYTTYFLFLIHIIIIVENGYVIYFLGDTAAYNTLIHLRNIAEDIRNFFFVIYSFVYCVLRLNQPGSPHLLPLSLTEKARIFSVRYYLTRREQEILYLVCDGKSNQTITAELAISDSTLKTHIQHIYKKCQIHERRKLIKTVHHIESPPTFATSHMQAEQM